MALLSQGLARRGPRLLASAAVVSLYLLALPAPSPEASLAAGLSLRRDRSRVLLRDGRLEDALRLTRSLSLEFPRDPGLWQQAATILARLGRPAEEAAAWERFLSVSSTPHDACPAIGLAYERAGQPGPALAAFERCLGHDERDPDSLFYLGHAYERAGRFEPALALYERGLALAPTYADLALGAARAKLRLGRGAEAERDVDAWIARRGESSDALLVAALARRERGDLAGAAERLERGARLAPGDADFPFVLGSIAESQGRAGDARRFYTRALALDPAREAARRGLERLGGAR